MITAPWAQGFGQSRLAIETHLFKYFTHFVCTHNHYGDIFVGSNIYLSLCLFISGLSGHRHSLFCGIYAVVVTSQDGRDRDRA